MKLNVEVDVKLVFERDIKEVVIQAHKQGFQLIACTTTSMCGESRYLCVFKKDMSIE